jgi:hypothetical protein
MPGVQALVRQALRLVIAKIASPSVTAAARNDRHFSCQLLHIEFLRR